MHATDPSTTMDDLVFIVVVFTLFFSCQIEKNGHPTILASYARLVHGSIVQHILTRET